MIKHILIALLTWPIWLTIRLLFIIAGLVVVPIALLFRTESEAARKPYPERKIVHLPKWAWPWDNDAEGMMSWMDEWPQMCWNGKPDSFLSMFQWAAIRNPANNLRFVRGMALYVPDIQEHNYWGDYSADDKYDTNKWSFVYAKGRYFPYYGFYWVGEKYYFQFGHKIEAKHFKPDFVTNVPERKLWKGMTFRLPNKKRDNTKYD